MNQPKRNLKIWIPIAAVLCFWLGDWMGHTYELTEGTTTHRLAAALNLNSLLLHPFRLSADAFSLGCGIATALMAGLIYLCVKYSKHRLMPQKEYGSARWGGPEDIAPFLDENAQNNLPLTASESLSLSPKMKVTANDNYNRNKNVIVFGPSGSGKSYSVAGPQLLQFNSNYVLSDPKGELLQEYGNVLLSQGYKVKVFNLKDRDKSDHYNLFAYIKNEDDILVVTKNLVKNLKEDPTAKSTADPIWEEGMTALLEALIGYVFYELELEERNMNSVMTLLLMLESQGDGPNSVSQLDLLFDDLSINKPKAPAYRVVDTIESPLQAGASALNYHDDFDTDAVQNAGLHMAVAQTVVEGNIMAAAADSAFVIGKQAGNILKDLKDETIDAKDALKAGGQVLRLQGGKSVVKIGGATLRSTEQYLSSFQVSTDDFTGSVPGKVKEAATNTGNILKKITNVVLHPLRNLIAMGKVILIGAVILLFLIIVSLLGQMSGTTSTSVFGANRIEDIQTLVQKINDYRNAAVTEGIYQAFQNDVDPNGNPYGYDSLTGQRSNNLQHGVTWNYANGIYNDTAEIISLAAVYYQQDWPRSELVSAFGDNVPFTKFCRALAAYGLDVTARESAPYSCMSYGGCVNGYRSEGEVVSIKDYRLETHTCSEGDDACGQYDAAAEWHWNEGHAENESYTVWKENGTHDVTVFFPVIFPDGATGSELSDLPEEYNAVADGKIKAADCTGNIVLDDSANLYKGELNDWFYTPDELTVTFTVVTGEGDDAVSDDYEVTFSNATAIPWCPGELNDGQYGHYDLDCTIYLTGYDRYTDPETQAPNGADGGTGNLEALAESCDAGTLTRTIIKQDQYGNEYAGNAVSARYTKTITLPNGANGFQGWYKDGEDAYGNVEWASLLYRMDWEELYGIVDGIKCRATGSGMTEEELRQLFASLNIDATTARGQVVAFALSCQGKFVYAQPSSLRGGPGNPSVGINLDCSSFVQYCYWAQNLLFSAGSTAAYRNAADLVSISPSEVQPGDLRVVYASGGEQGHVQMALGGGAWIECCYGYGVAVNMSNTWMESRPCYYFRYAGF